MNERNWYAEYVAAMKQWMPLVHRANDKHAKNEPDTPEEAAEMERVGGLLDEAWDHLTEEEQDKADYVSIQGNMEDALTKVEAYLKANPSPITPLGMAKAGWAIGQKDWDVVAHDIDYLVGLIREGYLVLRETGEQ